MARSLNKVMLIGNLGNDPEVRTVSSGTKVAEFSVATSRQWTGRDGQQQEKTEWHRIVAWGYNAEKDGLAGVAERFLKKGDRVYVEGAIEYRSYEDKEGVTKYITEIRASEMIMLSGRESGGGSYGGGPAAERQSSRPQRSAAPAAKKSGGYEGFEPEPFPEDDDLPF
ncbi:MAG TPA: single-stranded DNA-binding protein [Longimicrobiaceae bacterium]|nr:single-stranded DNA-binding protein [Longimicrobiaceae bacterium]